MINLKRLFSMCMVLGLAACGGGGGSAGTASFGGGTGGAGTTAPTVSDVAVQLSSSTIPNTGTGTATLTVTALDANRNAVPAAALTLAANSGAVLTVVGTAGSVTDATGRLQATVGIGADTSLRDITLSATSGTITRTAILKVVASPVGAVPTSIELIAGSTTVSTAGDGVVVRAFVKDINNNALSNTPVTFAASTGTLSGISSTTDGSGAASATLSSGADKSNRLAVITVTSGTVTSRLTLPISGTTLTLSGPTSLILGSSRTFTVTANDKAGNPVPNVPVTATSSLGNTLATIGETITNSSGEVRYSYTAVNSGTDTLLFTGAGTSVSPTPRLSISPLDFAFVSPIPIAPATITSVDVDTPLTLQVRLRSGGVAQASQPVNFAATGGTLTDASPTTNVLGVATVTFNSSAAGQVTVQATSGESSTTLQLVVVAKNPSKLVLQATQAAIGPNSQTTLLAKVTDAKGNPVQGKTVNFTRVTDPSGGNLQQVSSQTNASGIASVTYVSGAQSTANNGVRIRATVGDNATVADDTFLTVSQSALFIALGTGNVIDNLDPQTYKRDWVVYVTDSNGIPVNGVTLTIKVIPTHYLTGSLDYSDDAQQWIYSVGSPVYCPTEDTNANGLLDGGEDKNGDGVLWPGNVIAVTPGAVQTANGRATVSLLYAESYAPWVRVKLTASATVAGTESRTDTEFIVAGSASDFSSKTIPPAGRVSPFGLAPKGFAVCSPPNSPP